MPGIVHSIDFIRESVMRVALGVVVFVGHCRCAFVLEQHQVFLLNIVFAAFCLIDCFFLTRSSRSGIGRMETEEVVRRNREATSPLL